MAGWIGQSARRGILTTSFPDTAATPEEAPELGRAPEAIPGPTVDLSAAERLCPTSAIGRDEIAQGSCIRCGRCAAAGLRFVDPTFVAARPTDLLWPKGRPPAAVPGPSDSPFRRSVHVFLVDAGSCNACNLEVLALANPYYDSQRLGIFLTNSPRHADVLLVVGIPTQGLLEPLRRAYEALPSPKLVVAVGACALDGGIFRGAPNTSAPLAGQLPVDVFVPGCPPTPVAVLAGLLRAMGRGVPERRSP